MEGGRLSRPKHCSKGAQPVPKAVHRSSCRVKHNRPWCDSNLSPPTPQSGALTTRLLRPFWYRIGHGSQTSVVYPSTAQGLRKRDEHPAYMAYFTFIIVIIIIKGIYIAQVCKGHRCAVDTDGSMVT